MQGLDWLGIPFVILLVIALIFFLAYKNKKPSTAYKPTLELEAKRFARLLVSEIKLYNEIKVKEGLSNKDIYRRLKPEIDKARRLWQSRVIKQDQNTHDYFFDELVKILANGDADNLGEGFRRTDINER